MRGIACIAGFPSNDEIERYRDQELDLQLEAIGLLWGTSMETRLARLGEPCEFTVEATKKGIINGKRQDITYDEKITAIAVSQAWSTFIKEDPSANKILDEFRFHPFTSQLTSLFSSHIVTKRDKKDKLTKYALIPNDPDNLKLFNLYCKLRTLEGQTRHFFSSPKRAFLRETRSTFMVLRAHWETPREEARVTNRAMNNIGIGAEARSEAIAKLGDIDTESLVKQINDGIDPEKRIELMERLLKYEQGKADLAKEYVSIAGQNTQLINDLRESTTEKFREIMSDSEQALREDLLRGIEVQRKLNGATYE